MTKKIIVPTDFSENALIAAKYACNLAVKNNYETHLFHCYNSKTSIFDEKINTNENFTPLMRGEILINELSSSLLSEYPNIEIKSTCRDGLITEVLPKIATELNYSLIIIGSNGLTNDDSVLFGSTTYQIASASKTPVIAIPKKLKSNEINKAATLTNFKEDEIDSLKDFISLINSTPDLDIIHVYQNSDDLNVIQNKMNAWSSKIKESTGINTISEILKPIDYSNESLDTISEVVNKTLKESNYEIVIVTKTRKSFFDKWFSRSISKEVISKLETATFFDNK